MPGRRHAKRDCSLTPRHPCQAKTSRPRPRELFLHHHNVRDKTGITLPTFQKYSMIQCVHPMGAAITFGHNTFKKKESNHKQDPHPAHNARTLSRALSRAVRAHTHAHSTHQFSKRIASVSSKKTRRLLESGLGLVMWFIA